ncbi:MAG: methyltransferase domain-containing protein [Pseudonocardiaceae bacterium]|nr:methyltransferase domain-containing protein [Pseudonocardiaceae bacterium]
MSCTDDMLAVDDGEAWRRLEALADQLTRQGDLRTVSWRRAFTRVRRHVFLPSYLHDEEPGSIPARWRVVNGANLEDRDEWINAVYSDRTLITDLKGQPLPAEHGGGTHPIVTSSSTLPGLMLRMLEDLDIGDDMRVLEIGTGTGYNAALLSERLGDRQVTSIDIDPDLIASASRHLAIQGYHPHLVAGDGRAGVPDRAPHDRVIATCSVDRIPYAWVEQTQPGGKIMTNLQGPLMYHALALLTVTDHGTATGTFLPKGASFMRARHDPNLPFDHAVQIARPVDGDTSDTRRDPASLHHNTAWGFIAQACLSDAAFRLVIVDDEGNLGTEIATPDGSWAMVWHTPDNGRYHVSQAGPRRLWDILETTHQSWTDTGQPGWDRCRLTVTRDQQRISIDGADNQLDWPMS